MKKTYVTLLIVLIMLVTASMAYASPAASQNFAAPLSGRRRSPAARYECERRCHFQLSRMERRSTTK